MTHRKALLLPAILLSCTAIAAGGGRPALPPLPALFEGSERCQACHNSIYTPNGEDISIGLSWRATMMANASRDPYWQAGVRREILEHPESQAAIEAECSACHMPMARQTAVAVGAQGEVFANLPAGASAHPTALLAADGVSCSACHQVRAQGLGEPETYNGRFTVDFQTAMGQRPVLGPIAPEPTLTRVMKSASGFEPLLAPHVQQATFCASCHTLITHTLGPKGQVLGEFPEQVPFLEWKHSAYREQAACQSCHMPAVEGEVPLSSVLAKPRPHFSRHAFQGGNFFLARVFARFGAELGLTASVPDMERSHASTVEHLQTEAARLALTCESSPRGGLTTLVKVENLGGHKLPTAYPSRRTWIHFVARDSAGKVLFESGALRPDGAIEGNDNDQNAKTFEPHHLTIKASDQVQVYETIMTDSAGEITTGLLNAARYIKDNRVLPSGFEKSTAPDFVAVQGHALADPDFLGGSDLIRYELGALGATGPVTVQAELWYQPVAHHWAHNLAQVPSFEGERFLGYYKALAQASGVALARADTLCGAAAGVSTPK